MKKVIVLGAGLVGKEMAIDLSGKFDVTAVDINEGALDRIARQGVKTQRLDFTNEERLKNIIAGADLVVGCRHRSFLFRIMIRTMIRMIEGLSGLCQVEENEKGP